MAAMADPAATAGMGVMALLEHVSKSAAEATKSLGTWEELRRVLLEPQGAGEHNWVQAVEPLLKEAVGLLTQALAWEEQSSSVPRHLAVLTRQRWSQLVGRLTGRIKDVQKEARLAGDIKHELHSPVPDAVNEENTVNELRRPLEAAKTAPQQEPRSQNVLECWKGSYVNEGLTYSMTATLFRTGTNRLCGYGDDAIGQWTWEGETTGTHQVLLRKQYVTSPGYTVQYSGRRLLRKGQEVLQGSWSAGPDNSGAFSLQRDASSVVSAIGHNWTGYWESGSDKRSTDDTVFVFTSQNVVFGFGTDTKGEFMHTGTYSQEYRVLKITSVKMYQPDIRPHCLHFWGQLFLTPTNSITIEGKWSDVKHQKYGTFHLHSPLPSTGISTIPEAQAITSKTLHFAGELEAWEGWYLERRSQKQMSAKAFLMDDTRPCGFGVDYLGEWTWEGDFVVEDRMVLRKQYLNNPSYRLQYDGIRSSEDGQEQIRGHWTFHDMVAMFEPSDTHTFFLHKVETGAAAGYGAHWTGYREVCNPGSAAGTQLVDGGALVISSSNRIFGFGSDVAGTFTFLGTVSRQSHILRLRMTKLYAPGKPCPVHYTGQIDLHSRPAATTVMEGSWASIEDDRSGTFRFQARDPDTTTLSFL